MTAEETRAKAQAAFLTAVKGVPGHHVIAAMNIATPGIEWRHCSKAHLAESYARGQIGERVSLSWTACECMRVLNLEVLRHAALERGHGNPKWFEELRDLARAAIKGKTR